MVKHNHDLSQELPVAFLIKMAGLLGDEYDDFLSSLTDLPKNGLRVNTLKISAMEFSEKSPYELSALPWCSSGFSVGEFTLEPGTMPPGKHPYHSAGLYYLQEPSAMAAAELLAPLPGEKVLDLAAAPGGKTTHLAGLMNNTGLLVANEIHPDRVWDLAENLERCGVTNAIVTNETPARLADHFGVFFDRVMLDAPCSGEGMFSKSEQARRDWAPETASSCAMRQSAILEQAARMVKPGGCLAYTTCTFAPEENETVIFKFLDEHPEFDLKPIDPTPWMRSARPDWIGLPHDHKLNRAVRIWPHHGPGEGHFIAILVKSVYDEPSQSGIKPAHKLSRKRIIKSRDSAVAYAVLADFAHSHLNLSFEHRNIDLVGSYIYCLPDRSSSMDELKVIHPGWWLGSMQKDRFTPSHALAMGIRSDQARQTVDLRFGDEKVLAYLAGESFNHEGENGWVLITVDGFPLGWGKRVQNVVKNYYPKGLRRVPKSKRK